MKKLLADVATLLPSTTPGVPVTGSHNSSLCSGSVTLCFSADSDVVRHQPQALQFHPDVPRLRSVLDGSADVREREGIEL